MVAVSNLLFLVNFDNLKKLKEFCFWDFNSVNIKKLTIVPEEYILIASSSNEGYLSLNLTLMQ